MTGAWRWIAALLVVATLSCAKSTGDRTESVPDDFRMRFGEGGGVTGLWQGSTVHADGTVASWQGRSEKAEDEAAGKIDAKSCAMLWKSVEDAGFFELDSRPPGNMTRVIEVTAEGRTHSVRWALGDDDAATLNDLFEACREMLATASSET